MSFEALEKQVFSEASDVWSYGVLCVEVLARTEPFPDIPLNEFAKRVLPEKLTVVDQIPAETPEFLAKLIKNCFQVDPRERPTFDKICIAFM